MVYLCHHFYHRRTGLEGSPFLLFFLLIRKLRSFSFCKTFLGFPFPEINWLNSSFRRKERRMKLHHFPLIFPISPLKKSIWYCDRFGTFDRLWFPLDDVMQKKIASPDLQFSLKRLPVYQFFKLFAALILSSFPNCLSVNPEVIQKSQGEVFWMWAAAEKTFFWWVFRQEAKLISPRQRSNDSGEKVLKRTINRIFLTLKVTFVLLTLQ